MAPLSLTSTRVTLKDQSRSHRFSMAYISKSIYYYTFKDGQEVTYGLSFGGICFDLE